MKEVFNTASKVIITCNKRLSPFLQEEIKELEFEIKRAFNTGVELHASINDCIRLNLNLRTASQVLYEISAFRANDPKELYDALVKIEWEELIPFDGRSEERRVGTE